jgi:hypothetical protein
MQCTPSYCDLHDYLVAPGWCKHAWAIEREKQETITKDDVRREVWRAIDEVHEELRQDLNVSRLRKRPQRHLPPPADEKKFKGFSV